MLHENFWVPPVYSIVSLERSGHAYMISQTG